MNILKNNEIILQIISYFITTLVIKGLLAQFEIRTIVLVILYQALATPCTVTPKSLHSLHFYGLDKTKLKGLALHVHLHMLPFPIVYQYNIESCKWQK